MTINWAEVILLFGLSIPGIVIAIPRIMRLLLPESSEILIQRISRLAIMQTFFMVFIMALGGSVLSSRTGLAAPMIDGLLQGDVSWTALRALFLPALLYGFIALLVFFVLFYGIIRYFLDNHSFQTMRKFHHALGLDGAILYGGVVEEIIARWGIMNLSVFFIMLFTGHREIINLWFAIIATALLYTSTQLPAYFAAGCKKNRRTMIAVLIPHLWLTTVFGLLFWYYGLLTAILAHMFFHFGWFLYDTAPAE